MSELQGGEKHPILRQEQLLEQVVSLFRTHEIPLFELSDDYQGIGNETNGEENGWEA